MATKAKLTYFRGRGRGELVRLTLAAAGVEFEDYFLTEPQQIKKLRDDGDLLFMQVPLLEIDGMKLVQTSAIAHYVAHKHNMMGKTPEEHVMIDMLYEGSRDFYSVGFASAAFEETKEGKQKKFEFAKSKANNRYLPIFDKVYKQSTSGFLVGESLSLADIGWLEVFLCLQEIAPEFCIKFPSVAAFTSKISSLPRVSTFLKGPQRQPPPDDVYVTTVRKVLEVSIRGMKSECIQEPARETYYHVSFFCRLGVLFNSGRIAMASKAKLTYTQGRGLAEVIRLTLTAAGVEFEDYFISEPEQMKKLLDDGDLLFRQIPSLEIDGLKLVQSSAIARYVAHKYKMTGKTPEEQAMVDMMFEGSRDFYRLGFATAAFKDTEEEKQQTLELIKREANNRYLPAFEKVYKQSTSGFLVGDSLSLADLGWLDVLLWLHELEPEFAVKFPAVAVFTSKISSLPRVSAFLKGHQRQPTPDADYVAIAKFGECKI
ncbi:uncharacterized protein LOC110974392 [Acanthaster planci]|uniref:Uncharacterized protein LOC110974392 n=1 Tax=Acanthaster planci TaxID=133434 RepID=A0A8B7XNV1_ACAPL|nr:uncharacterized protein LOC110974392 [Acanthaster planci]